MKLKNIKVFSLLIFVLLFASCEDILEKESKTNISEATINTQSSILGLLYGTYDVIQWQAIDGRHIFPILFQDVRAAGVVSQNNTYYGDGLRFDDFNNLLPDNANIRHLWIKWYSGVNRANYAIKKATEFTGWENADLQDQIIAEAKSLRAFFYFELVRMWGSVPMYLDPILQDNEIPDMSNVPAAQIYTQIDKDLSEAISSGGLLKKGDVDPGRITIGAARAILAKSKLYQKSYTECASLCEEIINSGEFSLEPNFLDNFSLENENGVESVFEIQYADGFTTDFFEQANRDAQGSAMWQMSYPWMYWNVPLWQSYGNFKARRPFMEGYLTADEMPLFLDEDIDPIDTRYFGTFLTIGSNIQEFSPQLATYWLHTATPPPNNPDQITQTDGDKLTIHILNLNGDTWNTDAPGQPRKYLISFETLATLLEPSQSPLNEKIIRYSEVLLMHAEARLEGGTGTISGEESLAKVINRALGNGNNNGTFPTGVTFRNFDDAPFEYAYDMRTLMAERRKELAMEGWNAFSDLIRWEKAAELLAFKNFTPNRDELLPIPQAEIDAIGPETLKQNPGYN